MDTGTELNGFLFGGRMLINYEEYLKSEKWHLKRANVLVFWGNKCSICKGNKNLQVHHNTYEHITEERMSELVVLCEECHKLFSKRIRLHGYEPIEMVAARYSAGTPF